MMEFVSMKVAMLDWYDREDRGIHFLKEDDVDRCATERLLRNQFYDPLVSSESEDDTPPNNINWDEIFKNNKQLQKNKLFVPCVRPSPPYPRVSELNPHQHIKILKILSVDNPNILGDLFLGKPTRKDFKEFEAVKEIYLKEQEAYKEWAKSLWVTDHCIRALRPKPAVEQVYEAEFKMKMQRVQTLPKHYDLAAQISLESGKNDCDAVLKEELITVTSAEIPLVQIPDKIEKQFNIITPCTVPEPCQKHPYQIVLPNEETLSMLPITEIHRELAIFALNNDTQYIASENALKCLTQLNRHWLLPLSVCDTIGPDGRKVNVLVLDSEFSVHKEAAPMRSYKAFRHLLESALIPSSERERIWEISKSKVIKKEVVASAKFKAPAKSSVQDVDMSSDDEDSHLFIDTGDDVEITEPKVAGFGSRKTGFAPPSACLRSPKAGFAPPSACLCSPKSGFAPPAANLRSPKAGFSPPAANLRSPKAGFSPPAANLRSPKAGFAPPAANLRSPKAGFASPTESIYSPKAGFAPPAANLRSPKAGFASTTESLFSPKAGFASPNAGFVSPDASFGSPKALTFGSPPAKKSMRGNVEDNRRRSARLSNQATTGDALSAASNRLSEECPVVSAAALTKAARGTVDEPSQDCAVVTDIGLYSCTCKGTSYEKPPRRSFRKWQFRREGTDEKHDIIIHSPHKAKDKTEELILEPLPEYQIDLGASEPAPDAVRSAALSLALRKKAALLNVRIDGQTGDVATFEKLSSETFADRHPDVTRQVISTIHAALSQLQELRPGHYVLQHEPSHGANAMLMSPACPGERHSLVLTSGSAQLIDDEAHLAKVPPTISTALLPYHKHRRVLPCAFTPYENQVMKETKKPPPKKKAPPQAIKLQAEALDKEPRRKVSKGLSNKFNKLPAVKYENMKLDALQRLEE